MKPGSTDVRKPSRGRRKLGHVLIDNNVVGESVTFTEIGRRMMDHCRGDTGAVPHLARYPILQALRSSGAEVTVWRPFAHCEVWFSTERVEAERQTAVFRVPPLRQATPVAGARRLNLGRVACNSWVVQRVAPAEFGAALGRHASLDFGLAVLAVVEANRRSLQRGTGPVVSIYEAVEGGWLHVTTDLLRRTTEISLPSPTDDLVCPDCGCSRN